MKDKASSTLVASTVSIVVNTVRDLSVATVALQYITWITRLASAVSIVLITVRNLRMANIVVKLVACIAVIASAV